MTTPPTKRFFYRDPLAAAWMAKHFGMSFHDGALEEILWPWDYLYEKKADWSTAVFHVHPDSLHLLEPQPSDCVLIRSEGVVGFVYPGGLFGAVKVLPEKETGMRVGQCFPASDLIIIQRNGVAFMQPESEDA